MRPIVLRTVARLMAPVLLVFSVVMLLRGHDLPGGGFIGGLLAAAAFVLMVMGMGVVAVRTAFRLPARAVAAFGLLLTILAGSLGFVVGDSFLQSKWITVELLTLSVDLGTPLLFDVGVYLAVLGVALGFVFNVEGR